MNLDLGWECQSLPSKQKRKEGKFPNQRVGESKKRKEGKFPIKEKAKKKEKKENSQSKNGSAGSNSPKKREGWNPFWVYLGPQEKEKKSDQNKFKK